MLTLVLQIPTLILHWDMMGILFTSSSFRIQVHISIITTERTDALTDSIHSHDKSCLNGINSYILAQRWHFSSSKHKIEKRKNKFHSWKIHTCTLFFNISTYTLQVIWVCVALFVIRKSICQFYFNWHLQFPI